MSRAALPYCSPAQLSTILLSTWIFPRDDEWIFRPTGPLLDLTKPQSGRVRKLRATAGENIYARLARVLIAPVRRGCVPPGQPAHNAGANSHEPAQRHQHFCAGAAKHAAGATSSCCCVEASIPKTGAAAAAAAHTCAVASATSRAGRAIPCAAQAIVLGAAGALHRSTGVAEQRFNGPTTAVAKSAAASRFDPSSRRLLAHARLLRSTSTLTNPNVQWRSLCPWAVEPMTKPAAVEPRPRPLCS